MAIGIPPCMYTSRLEESWLTTTGQKEVLPRLVVHAQISAEHWLAVKWNVAAPPTVGG